MKRYLYLTVVALSALVLLALPLLPHHHHDGAWCDVVEHCEKDHAANDRHTGHRGDGTTCLETAAYTVAKSQVVSQTMAVHRLHFILLFPLLFACLSALYLRQGRPLFPAPIVGCPAADVVRAVGRRGPPMQDVSFPS